MFKKFTIDDLENYSNILHFEIVLAFSVNLPVIYLILKRSTKAMGYYKYYLLYTVITALMMDFHQTIVFGIYMTLPAPGGCCTGFCKNWGPFWGPEFNFELNHITLSITAFGLVAGLMYRYYALNGELKFFESKIALPTFFVVGVVYTAPTLTLYALASTHASNNLTKHIFETSVPKFLPLLDISSCAVFDSDGSSNAYFISAVVQLLLVPLFSLIYVFKTIKLLKAVRSSLSASTYAAQKQLFIALCLQIGIPNLCFAIPITVLLICYMAGTTNFSTFSEVAVEFIVLHSTMNGIMIVFTIKPYRQAVMKIIFRKKEKRVHFIQPSQNSFGLKENSLSLRRIEVAYSA